MRYQLLEKHYVNDLLLEAGTIVGVPGDKDISAYWVMPDGFTPREPSRAMKPLDKDAEEVFGKRFPDYVPDIDPTKPIPVMGTGSGAYAPGVAPSAPPVRPSQPQAHNQGAAPKSASTMPASPTNPTREVPQTPPVKPSVSVPTDKK